MRLVPACGDTTRSLFVRPIVMVTATDPASERDFQSFSQQSGIALLQMEKSGGKFVYWLQKP